MEKKKLKIKGESFSDLKGFYDEIERSLTKVNVLDWKMGRNLDALNDVLEGGFGRYDNGEEIELVWVNSDRSKLKLGYEETMNYFEDRLRNCDSSNRKDVQKELEMVKNGNGKMLFEIIVGIIKEHQHIKLKME